jgi:hypothetical protein
MFREANHQLSVMRVAFLLWIFTVCLCWAGMSIYDKKLDELPATIVHITITLSAAKVSHRVAEGNWESVIKKVIDAFKKRE